MVILLGQKNFSHNNEVADINEVAIRGGGKEGFHCN